VTYADRVIAQMTAIRTLLRNSTRIYLAAVNDKYINLGQPQTEGMSWPGINIMESSTSHQYSTVSMIEMECNIMVIVYVSHVEAEECHKNAIYLVGDIYDEISTLANTTLSGSTERAFPADIRYLDGRGKSGYITVAEMNFTTKISDIVS